MAALILKTGVDIVEIDRLENLSPGIRDRFLRRVFTPEELNIAGESLASLAGRFAAKEAVAKALGCGMGQFSFQEIEIKRGANGDPVLTLHGTARRIADELGLSAWSISISHSRSNAVAVAVAIGNVC